MKNSPVTRRTTLTGLGALGLAAPLSRSWAQAGGTSLNFLAIGDWGRNGTNNQREVAVRMGESASEIDARFVISVGDNFYEDGVAGLDDPAWQSSFEKVYDAPSLQVPWQVALGNHDYHGDSQAQLDYSARSQRWRLPARWYQFEEQMPDGGRVVFFVIDTSPMLRGYYEDGAVKVKVAPQEDNVPIQLAWLDTALAASRADWNIVIGHHPIYTGNGRVASPRPLTNQPNGTPELVAGVDPILQRYRVPLYMNGHEHDLQHVHHGATHYVCSGAGSKMAPACGSQGNDFCSLRSGFVACSVNRGRLRVAYRDYTGAELHVVDIPRAG